MNLNKKVAKVPIWGWLLISAGVIGFMWYRSRSSSGTPNNANQVDPNSPLGLTYAQENADLASGIDPNTGQSFASEQSAADGSLQGSGGGGSTDNTNPIQTFTGEIGDLTTLLTVLDKFEHNVQKQFPRPPTAAKQIPTHKGGPFYNWYLKTFGKPPPKVITTDNPAYQTWLKLRKAGRLPKDEGGKGGKGGHNGSGGAGHIDQGEPLGHKHNHKHVPSDRVRPHGGGRQHIRGNRHGHHDHPVHH
jgi:hypothetical protein